MFRISPRYANTLFEIPFEIPDFFKKRPRFLRMKTLNSLLNATDEQFKNLHKLAYPDKQPQIQLDRMEINLLL